MSFAAAKCGATRCCAAALAAALLVSACATGPRDGVRERFDEASTLTVRTDARPIVFARTLAAYSRNTRDYLYLGPVETNRRGTREYYLWVGVATTLDHAYVDAPELIPQVLYADVDGEPMALPLRPWQESAPDLAGAAPYRTPVHVGRQLAARLTAEQLRLLAGAPLAALRAADGSGRTQSYFRWDDGPNWPGLVERKER